MPLAEEDKKEVVGLISETLGLKEGEKLTDVLGKLTKDAANDVVNAYDKRKTKEGGKLNELVEGLTKEIETLKTSKNDDDDEDTIVNGQPNLEKLPKGVQAYLKQQAKELEAIKAKSAKAEEETAKEKAAREKVEAERADQELVKALEGAVDGEVDPTLKPALVALLHRERKIVRAVDGGGGYEIHLGEKLAGEPVYEELKGGIGKYLKTDEGKRFRPATPGGNPPTPPKTPGGGANKIATLEEMSQMTPEQIRKAADAGQF